MLLGSSDTIQNNPHRPTILIHCCENSTKTITMPVANFNTAVMKIAIHRNKLDKKHQPLPDESVHMLIDALIYAVKRDVPQKIVVLCERFFLSAVSFAKIRGVMQQNMATIVDGTNESFVVQTDGLGSIITVKILGGTCAMADEATDLPTRKVAAKPPPKATDTTPKIGTKKRRRDVSEEAPACEAPAPRGSFLRISAKRKAEPDEEEGSPEDIGALTQECMGL